MESSSSLVSVDLVRRRDVICARSSHNLGGKLLFSDFSFTTLRLHELRIIPSHACIDRLIRNCIERVLLVTPGVGLPLVLDVPLALTGVYMSINMPARHLAPELRQGARHERLQPGRSPIKGPKSRHCRGLE